MRQWSLLIPVFYKLDLLSPAMELIAKTLHGLEGVLQEELKELGAQNIQVLKRAVRFEGDKELLYRANLELRTALRVLLPIHQFKARNEEQLYRAVGRINWSKYLDLDQTFAIDSVVHSPFFRHSKYAALKTKDAIVDQFRRLHGQRPSVNVLDPNLRIHLLILDQECQIMFDSSDQPLFKRGYRARTVEAPINEVLAAGILKMAGWPRNCHFLDPMCGSGTFVVEAALMAHSIVPQRKRKGFGFQLWNNYDEKLWQSIWEPASQRITSFDYRIVGSDKAIPAFKASQFNVEEAGLEGKVELFRKKFDRLPPIEAPCLLVFNPPYDVRLSDGGEGGILAFYKSIGDTLKKHYQDCEAWMISSNKDAIKKIGLRTTSKRQLFNGSLECRLLQYELYEGSRKNKEE